MKKSIFSLLAVVLLVGSSACKQTKKEVKKEPKKVVVAAKAAPKRVARTRNADYSKLREEEMKVEAFWSEL